MHLPMLPGLKISLPSPPTFVLALPFVRLNHLACYVDDSGRPQPLLLHPDSKSRADPIPVDESCEPVDQLVLWDLLKRNIRGANKNNFHARQCRCSSPEALAALASWRANLSTDLQAPRMNLGRDLKTTARRRSRTIPSTSSKLLIASRNTRLGFTSSNGVGSDSTSDGATSPATLSKSSLKTDAFSPTCAPPTTLTVSSVVGSSMSLTTGMPLMWCCASSDPASGMVDCRTRCATRILSDKITKLRRLATRTAPSDAGTVEGTSTCSSAEDKISNMFERTEGLRKILGGPGLRASPNLTPRNPYLDPITIHQHLWMDWNVLLLRWPKEWTVLQEPPRLPGVRQISGECSLVLLDFCSSHDLPGSETGQLCLQLVDTRCIRRKTQIFAPSVSGQQVPSLLLKPIAIASLQTPYPLPHWWSLSRRLTQKLLTLWRTTACRCCHIKGRDEVQQWRQPAHSFNFSDGRRRNANGGCRKLQPKKRGRRLHQRIDGGCSPSSLGDVVLSLRAQLQAQQFLLQNMNGTVEEAVNNAVTTLASDLHDRMQSWEGRHRWHGMHGTKCRDGGEDAIAHGKICGGRVLKSTWTNLEEP